MENVNSVAYVAQITDISPIEGADKIEQAKCGEWSCVVQKGIHKEGDVVLCITQDAIIPEDLAKGAGVIEYLRNRKGAGVLTVRTVKLKGVYSECILLPMEGLFRKPELLTLGQDMQEKLGIYKYEEPERFTEIIGKNGKKIRQKVNPNFHVYYKFPNAKNITIFKDGDPCIITRKKHGTNARYALVKKVKLGLWARIKKFFWFELKLKDKYEFVYGSRQVQKGKGDSGFYRTDVWAEQAKKLKLKKRLETIAEKASALDLEKGIVFYGEIIGPGVQGDKYDYGLSERILQLFDVMIVNEHGHDCYLPEQNWRALAHTLDFTKEDTVEVLYEGPWSKEIENKLSQGVNIAGTKIPHEGIVVKDPSGRRDRVYKVINRDYHIFAEKHNVPENH